MDRPNLLFVTTDHLRRDIAGMPSVAPNLNALADRGVEFANAYCPAPLCMPSRNSLVTGQFPSRNGVCSNMNEPLDAEQRTDPDERENLIGDPAAADARRRLTERLCDRLIRQSNRTHEKEQMRVQEVRV